MTATLGDALEAMTVELVEGDDRTHRQWCAGTYENEVSRLREKVNKAVEAAVPMALVNGEWPMLKLTAREVMVLRVMLNSDEQFQPAKADES